MAETGAASPAPVRIGRAQRATRESRVEVVLCLDRPARPTLSTGLGFFDHMLAALATHADWSLELKAEGDLEVDAHHVVEDSGITLGRALGDALGDMTGVERFGDALVPLDEALAQCAVDFSGRPYLAWRGRWPPFPAGGLYPDLWPEFFRGLCRGAGATLHVRLLQADNGHHAAEAVFKAAGRALGMAARRRAGRGEVSTKGSIDR
jgi:imidazoleglycerol phosphate dehydratase HisB